MRRRYTHLQTGEEFVPIPEAVCIEETEKGVRLRLKSGREEWFPKAHVVHCDDGWFIKRWLADKRRAEHTKRQIDTSCMRPRAAYIAQDLMLLVLAFGLALATGLGFVEAHCNMLPLTRRALQHER